MSDLAPTSRPKPYATIIAAGLASALLYLSILFSFAFLVPVQIAFGRKGGKAGMAAAAVSAVCIAVAQGLRLAGAGATGLSAIAAGIAAPLTLLLALALINAPLGKAWSALNRTLLATLICALAALPLFIELQRDSSIAANLEKLIGSFLEPLRQTVAGSSDGYEASALAASLDPKDLVATSLTMLRDSYAAMIFLVLASSRRLGNRWSGVGSPGRAETGIIDELRIPYPYVWAFLIAWSLVLATVLLRASDAASAIAWNCAMIVSLAYAAQGLGIVTHLFKRWNMPKSLRILIAVMAVISLVTPLGIAVAASLPLFGVTEIWIHYRKPKGVGA